MPGQMPDRQQRTAKAMSHAITHWVSAVAMAARVLPISRFTVAIAATQGV